MTDLQTLLEAIDRLEPDELETVRERIEQRRTQMENGIARGETPEARIAILKQAFAEMRAGLSSQELQEVIEAINHESIEAEDQS
jgi:hypothetical protein